jgi:hypothetical protein
MASVVMVPGVAMVSVTMDPSLTSSSERVPVLDPVLAIDPVPELATVLPVLSASCGTLLVKRSVTVRKGL